MKIEATITEAKTNGVNGSTIELALAGWFDSSPQGTTAFPVGTLTVPRNNTTEAAYHVGRKVLIVVEPK